MSTIQVYGSLTRQLLPLDTHGAHTAELVRMFRWVTWMTDPCTAEMASGHLAVYVDGCVVRARRGPRGGWIDARFITQMSYPVLANMVHRGWLLHLGKLSHVTSRT